MPTVRIFAQTGLFAICALLFVGESMGFALSRYAVVWPLPTLAAIVFGLAWYGRSSIWCGMFAVLSLGLALSLHCAFVRHETVRAMEMPNGAEPFRTTLAVEGSVGSSSFASSYHGVRLKVIHAGADIAEQPKVGEKWECAGWLGRNGSDDFAIREFWVRGRGTSMRRVSAASGVGAFFQRIRDEFSRRMGIGLESSQDIADLNRAILLGERSRMTHETRDAFAGAGTMHIFAISGLHVMIVAQILAFILALMAVPYRFLGIALIPCLWLYVMVVGAPPSAVRAAMMASFYYAAPITWRRPNASIAWALTFLVVFVVKPAMVMDVGCMLSFTVMLGLIIAGTIIMRHVKGMLAFPFASVAAWLAGMPIVAHAFGCITPGGLFANLFLIPAASVSVVASFLGIAASFVSSSLAAHINNFAALFTGAMLGLSRLVASFPLANISVAPWSGVLCVEWYAVMLLSAFLVDSVLTRRRYSI